MNVTIYVKEFIPTCTKMVKEMIGVLGHDSALEGYTGPGPTWANEINLMNHAPGAGSST